MLEAQRTILLVTSGVGGETFFVLDLVTRGGVDGVSMTRYPGKATQLLQLGPIKDG